MSILKYLHPLNQNLPNPFSYLSEQIPLTAVASANVKVLEALEGNEEKKKRARGLYLSSTPAQKYEIGKLTAEHGVTASIWYFNKKYLDLSLKETTI